MKMKERKLNNKGFSLVELIIVIAIMVILVVAIAPQYTKFVKNSRIAADVQTAQAAATAIDVAVAEGKTGMFSGTPSVYSADAPVVRADMTAKMGGTFKIYGTDAAGVSKITLVNPTGAASGEYECYPNPDVSGNGLNNLKNN
ncbi:MAG: prepilin-type N-terminal cleavage/methylation domain-containing protein [Lachnospiraceae bacterium]|nr:prepilin-type N-terminal cleavage/methylation domain-containing protein [Lachnospiraceae bacterium]